MSGSFCYFENIMIDNKQRFKQGNNNKQKKKMLYHFQLNNYN